MLIFYQLISDVLKRVSKIDGPLCQKIVDENGRRNVNRREVDELSSFLSKLSTSST